MGTEKNNTGNEHVLEVYTLGGFALVYNGNEVMPGKSGTSKLVQLLQLVWLQGEKGIGKDQLMRLIFDRDNVMDLSNSLNNLIYRMRKQMALTGMPEGNYITLRDGIYVTDDTVEVRVDAIEFEKMAEKASAASSETEKYHDYLHAVQLYRGELLPAISTETWVTMESLRLKRIYDRCVDWLGKYLKEQKDYDMMYHIYSNAAKLYPFDSWQVSQIDSLLCKEEYKEAYRLYDKTVRMYSDKMGLPPSKEMLDCYKAMGKKFKNQPGNLQKIQSELAEEAKEPENSGAGAYYCSYPSFIDTYRLLSRIIERSGQSVFLMLCTLVDYEGKFIQNPEKLRKRSEALKEAIGLSIRRSDGYTKYSDSQYLILLTGTRQEDCYIVFNRIIRELKRLAGSRAEINYNVTSLAELKGIEKERGK
ncbi:bacterial transcriptional activator domain-containing protein [Clostridium transplantifaecale]|uniref:bacterial transcriptional activator domain-containing protein n=1 Tax=Clostridium transplantifaecale TaxID=2479838 RepID=UPI000F63F7FE|nr:bacterial transcriptional activator domain-containing protein [Clostridium transplantifaecale]